MNRACAFSIESPALQAVGAPVVGIDGVPTQRFVKRIIPTGHFVKRRRDTNE